MINIYVDASRMMYLHSRNILHRDLIPMNNYLDEYLFQKIDVFGLSTVTMTYQSKAGLKRNRAYLSPDVLWFNDYSKSSDIYSFGFISYEILCSEITINGIFNEVINNENPPKITERLQKPYWKMLGSRKTEGQLFEEIIEHIKCYSNFIFEKIKKVDYFNFIEFIDESW